MIPSGALVEGPVFLRLEMPGVPGHKARHRSRIVFPRSGKPFIHIYPDPTTEAYEKALAQLAAILMRGRKPIDGPFSVLVEAQVPVPKSWPERDRIAALEGRLLPESRPDGDNYLKLIDSLNKIVWDDDARAADSSARKRYSANPMLRITVRKFVPPESCGDK